jgi:predicted nucleic acid-binding protein
VIKSVNDTNVWITGINWDRGAGYRIRLHWETGRFQHFISAEILYEIIRVLRKVFEYSDESLYDWYWLLLTGSVFVVPRVIINVIREDPDDNNSWLVPLREMRITLCLRIMISNGSERTIPLSCWENKSFCACWRQ